MKVRDDSGRIKARLQQNYGKMRKDWL